MSDRSFLTVAALVPFMLLTASPGWAGPPPATCIGKHCAVVPPAAAPAAPVPIVETGVAVVLHPAVGIYCVGPAGKRNVNPYVPLVTVSDNLSKSFNGNTNPAAALADIAFGAPNCPVVDPPGAPFLQVDTYSILPGAPAPIVVPSDDVGFLIQF